MCDLKVWINIKYDIHIRASGRNFEDSSVDSHSAGTLNRWEHAALVHPRTVTPRAAPACVRTPGGVRRLAEVLVPQSLRLAHLCWCFCRYSQRQFLFPTKKSPVGAHRDFARWTPSADQRPLGVEQADPQTGLRALPGWGLPWLAEGVALRPR